MSSSPSPLQALSPEHLVTISTYLPTSDVWSLASINKFAHSTLLNGQGALREIWIHKFQDKFPVVLDQQQRLNPCSISSSSDNNIDTAEHESTEKTKKRVVLVDRLNTHITSSRASSNIIYGYGYRGGGGKNSEQLNQHHLPQLSNLLPESYPQSIDYTRMPSKQSFKITSGSLSSKANGMRSRSSGSCVLSLSGIQDEATLPLPSAAGNVAHHENQVPLIKFSGKVGHSDRSIRSDAAFPSRVRYFPSSFTLSSTPRPRAHEQQSGRRGSLRRFLGTREKGSKWTTSWKRFTSLSALLKEASARGFQRATTETDASSANSECFQRESTLNTLNLNSARSTTSTSMMLTRDLISSAVNENDRIVRPFVIPTVVSQQKDVTVVDLTPRLVAYYEVTILDEQAKESSSGEGQQQHGDEDQEAQGEGSRHEDHTQEDSRSGRISVGLSTLLSKLDSNMPGWDEHSYGYHGDDGRTFYRGKRSSDEIILPVFGCGDTIGCGIEYRSSGAQIFFVKNGTLLTNSFHSIGKKVLRKGLYPTVGIDSNCPIHVNFGQVPFKFDLGSFSVKKERMRSWTCTSNQMQREFWRMH